MDVHRTIRRQGGFTLLEVMMALTVLAMAMMGIGMTFVSATRLSTTTSQEMAAVNAIRAQMAKLRSDMAVDYLDGSDRYRGIDGLIARVDLGGETTFTPEGVEESFLVENNVVDMPPKGEVLVYLDEATVPDAFGGNAGLDLNGDDLIADDLGTPANGRYPIDMVPVEIKVTWRGPHGESVSTSRFMLIARLD